MSNTKDILLGSIRNGGSLSLGQQLKLCLMLSYPAILAQLSSVMMQYIDTSMVGHLGAAAGASIGLVSTCLWLFGGFGMAVTSGFSVQVAHRIGANDFEGARSVLRQALVCGLGFSALLALLGMSISSALPYWLGGGEDIAPDAGRYFFIIALFMPAMQLDWMCAAILQASGNMKVPSILSIGMCVLDVCFNYLFIYVLDMGVTGAALGSGLAEIITGLAMFSFAAFKSPELNLRQEKGSFRPTAPVVKKALGISGPMALQNILMRGGYIASTVIVAPLGTIALAANSFAITAESFCYMPGYGIADASTTLVGQSVGAGRKPLAKRFAWITCFLGMGIMGLLAILMYAFAPQMMGLLTPDADRPGSPRAAHRSLRRSGLCRLHCGLWCLCGCRRHPLAQRSELLLHVAGAHCPGHLPHTHVRPGGLLDLHGGGTELPRPPLPHPPVSRPLVEKCLNESQYVGYRS